MKKFVTVVTLFVVLGLPTCVQAQSYSSNTPVKTKANSRAYSPENLIPLLEKDIKATEDLLKWLGPQTGTTPQKDQLIGQLILQKKTFETLVQKCKAAAQDLVSVRVNRPERWTQARGTTTRPPITIAHVTVQFYGEDHDDD